MRSRKRQRTQSISYSTVRQFCEKHEAFSEGGIRWLIFNATPRPNSKGEQICNNLGPAFVRIGRRIYINEKKFFELVNNSNTQRKP